MDHQIVIRFWERGGGASGEHSHALNLWQYLAKESKLGTILNINHMLDYYKDKQVNYDKICMLNLDTVDGYKGRVIQDVITKPSKKIAFIQGTLGRIEDGFVTLKKNSDKIIIYSNTKKETLYFSKKRPDDFITELKHVCYCIKNNKKSPISLENGLETMKILKKYIKKRIKFY